MESFRRLHEQAGCHGQLDDVAWPAQQAQQTGASSRAFAPGKRGPVCYMCCFNSQLAPGVCRLPVPQIPSTRYQRLSGGWQVLAAARWRASTAAAQHRIQV